MCFLESSFGGCYSVSHFQPTNTRKQTRYSNFSFWLAKHHKIDEWLIVLDRGSQSVGDWRGGLGKLEPPSDTILCQCEIDWSSALSFFLQKEMSLILLGIKNINISDKYRFVLMDDGNIHIPFRCVPSFCLAFLWPLLRWYWLVGCWRLAIRVVWYLCLFSFSIWIWFCLLFACCCG